MIDRAYFHRIFVRYIFFFLIMYLYQNIYQFYEMLNHIFPIIIKFIKNKKHLFESQNFLDEN